MSVILTYPEMVLCRPFVIISDDDSEPFYTREIYLQKGEVELPYDRLNGIPITKDWLYFLAFRPGRHDPVSWERYCSYDHCFKVKTATISIHNVITILYNSQEYHYVHELQQLYENEMNDKLFLI